MCGLESQIANDLVLESGVNTRATRWGGEYGTTTCALDWPTPGLTFLFYEDGNCLSGALLVELPITDFSKEFLA
jgi:hypothetical protein